MGAEAELGRLKKIERGCLRSTAKCRIVHVVSPSLFWVRTHNHITQQLMLGVNDQRVALLPSHSRVVRGQYVLAPRSDQPWLYRAIVDSVIQTTGKHVAQLLFIDSGTKLSVPIGQLRAMPDLFYYHPWQAHPCCIWKLAPTASPDANSIWSSAAVDLMRTMADKTSAFRIDIVHHSRKPHFYVVKLLKEMADADPSAGPMYTDVSVLLRKAAIKQKVGLSLINMDADKQTIFAAEPGTDQPGSEAIDKSSTAVRRRRVLNANTAQSTIGNNTTIPYLVGACPTDTRLLVGNQIQKWTVHKLQAQGDTFLCKVVLCMPCTSNERTHTATPSEFYVQPALHLDQDDPTHSLNQTMSNTFAAWRDKLDEFYAESNSRTPLARNRLEAVKHGIYAMADCRSCPRARWLGAWRRVRLLKHVVLMHRYTDAHTSSSRDDMESPELMCLVRFEDAGGTDVLSFSKLFEINAVHCLRLPMAIQCRVPVRPAGRYGKVGDLHHDWNDPTPFVDQLRADSLMQARVQDAIDCTLRVTIASLYESATIIGDVFNVVMLRQDENAHNTVQKLIDVAFAEPEVGYEVATTEQTNLLI